MTNNDIINFKWNAQYKKWQNEKTEEKINREWVLKFINKYLLIQGYRNVLGASWYEKYIRDRQQGKLLGKQAIIDLRKRFNERVGFKLFFDFKKKVEEFYKKNPSAPWCNKDTYKELLSKKLY